MNQKESTADVDQLQREHDQTWLRISENLCQADQRHRDLVQLAAASLAGRRAARDNSAVAHQCVADALAILDAIKSTEKKTSFGIELPKHAVSRINRQYKYEINRALSNTDLHSRLDSECRELTMSAEWIEFDRSNPPTEIGTFAICIADIDRPEEEGTVYIVYSDGDNFVDACLATIGLPTHYCYLEPVPIIEVWDIDEPVK